MNTAQVLLGLAFLARVVAHRYGLKSHPINVATVKKQFAGHGRADKYAMKARCRQLGWDVKDDNQADAAGLWYYAKATTDKAFAIKTTPIFAGAA